MRNPLTSLILIIFFSLSLNYCHKNKLPAAVLPEATQKDKKIIGFNFSGKGWLPYIITIVVMLLLLSFAHAQVNKKTLIINFGASSGYGYPSELGRSTDTENSGIPTLNLHAEYSLNSFFSLGPYTAYTYSFFKYDNPDPQLAYKDVWKGWDLGIRSTLHIGSFFLKKEKTDLYLTGFFGYITRALVYDKKNIYRDSLNYKVDAFGSGGMLGLHYFFNNKFGLYIETGLARKFIMGGGLAYKIERKKN